MVPIDPQAQPSGADSNSGGFRDEEFGRVHEQPWSNGKSMPYAGPPTPESGALVAVGPSIAPAGFRVKLTGDTLVGDAAQDATVLAYEYERRRAEWWRRRRLGLIGLPSLALIALVVSLMGSILNQGWAGLFFWLMILLLVGWVAFAVYCWLTLPRVISFGRIYRRLVSVPLSRNGMIWCDASVTAPNFLAMRDSFFTLYQESYEMGTRAQPTNNAEDTERKKQTLNDLSDLINPLLTAQPENLPTPFIHRDRTRVLDRVELEELGQADIADLALSSLPLGMQHLNTPLDMKDLAFGVEAYSTMKAEGTETALMKVSDDAAAAPLHRQIAVRVSENFSLVGAEVERWRERADRERAFHGGLLARYKEAEDQVRLGYERTALTLEEEIHGPTAQLVADATFYHEQIENFYLAQRQVIESRRDSALTKLEREKTALERVLDERSDEQALLQAEFKGLNDQRLRLENSTDSRFASLKSQLSDLTRRSYSLPAVPHFRSDFPEEPSALTTEESSQQLAELRAETRLAINAVNNSLNRFARVRLDPLDELGQLETQISAGSKWQATTFLGNLINFKQSGQLLALAGEVSEAVGVYLDTATDYERLNRRWCSLEASIRTLGLSASYNNRLQEAQEYLLGLSQVAGSLHSSLLSAPHSPEMARPATFQNIYDQAAGLQRELEELGGLAGSITRTEDQLTTLAEEIGQLRSDLEQNKTETEQIKTDASVKLYELSQKLKSIHEKLEELKTKRLKLIRGHVDDLADEKDATIKQLRAGANELGDVANTADKILRRHIGRADRMLDDARRLHRGLESTIATIVRDFEESILRDRYLQAPSELFVPVWYFQFQERPLWKQRVLGFASCYTGVELVPISQTVPEINVRKERASLWRFISSTKPATFYRLHEDNELASLVGAQELDYPAGRVDIDTGWLEKLASDGWMSGWLVKLIKRSAK